MSGPEGVRERVNRRRLGLLLLLLLALLGLGVGTLVDGPENPQPPVIEATPTPPTTTAPPPASPPDPTPTPPDGTPSPPPTTATPPTTAPPADGGVGDGGVGDGGAGGGSSGAGSGSSVTLQTAGSSAILQYSAVKPGDAGTGAITLRNAGSVAARLDIADISVTDEENGIVPAEAPYDTPGDGGELSEHVMIVIEVTYPDGTTEYFYDTDLGARSLSDLAGESGPSTGRELAPGEEATITFDWHVPVSTGNEIQSDGSDITVDFRLRSN